MYDVILVSAALFAGIFILSFMRRLRPVKKAEGGPLSLSVVIPARNEEHTLPLLLSDLRSQTLQPLEIICVDDESEDGTAGVIRAAGARYVRAEGRPEGWLGKSWACQCGAREASGSLILFLDADVRLSPDALASLVAEHLKHGGAVSVQPRHRLKRFYEHFSMYFNIVLIGCTGIGLPFRMRPIGMFGPVLLMPRALYEEHGGHEKVRGRVLEDFMLGRYYQKRKVPLSLRLGGSSVSFRMYAEGFRSLWQGWTKNVFSGAISTPVPLLLGVVLWLTGSTALVIQFIQAAVAADPLWLPVYGALYLAYCVHLMFVARRVGTFHPLACLFYPVFLLGFHVMFLVSAFRKLVLRRAVWKGRRIRV
jgi:4,4'-diaponeurosporenoate glycosyltransferase